MRCPKIAAVSILLCSAAERPVMGEKKLLQIVPGPSLKAGDSIAYPSGKGTGRILQVYPAAIERPS